MRAVAWLYLIAPTWLVRLLPGSVNHSDGAFSEAVDAAANRRAVRRYARIDRKLAQRKDGS